jgi:hypothetical protein
MLTNQEPIGEDYLIAFFIRKSPSAPPWVHGTNKQKMIAWALHGSMEHQPET